MAVSSTMLPLGTLLPEFTLIDARSGVTVSSNDLAATPVLVAFVCNHCPYVVHIRSEFVRVAHEAVAHGMKVAAINSNNTVTHPQDGPTYMRELANAEGWNFPFLFDAEQRVARLFDAQSTPEFYLFDEAHRLVYRGRLDESTPKNGKPVTGNDLRAAIQALSQHKPIAGDQLPSVGCSIKWNPT